jgi:hypothetical protein
MGSCLPILPYEFEGLFITRDEEQRPSQVWSSGNLVVKENCRSEKPISYDVAGSPSDPPTSVGTQPDMPTAKLQQDPTNRSRDTLDPRLLWNP